MLERLFDVEEGAAYLKVHPNTIRCWARARRLAGKKSGHRWVFTAEDLENFLEPQGTTPTRDGRSSDPVPAGAGHG